MWPDGERSKNPNLSVLPPFDLVPPIGQTQLNISTQGASLRQLIEVSLLGQRAEGKREKDSGTKEE